MHTALYLHFLVWQSPFYSSRWICMYTRVHSFCEMSLEIQRQRERQYRELPFAGSLWWPGPCQAEVGSQDLSPVAQVFHMDGRNPATCTSPTTYQGTHSRKLDSQAELGLKTRYTNMGFKCLTRNLPARWNACFLKRVGRGRATSVLPKCLQ